jgi:hypothetical protein
MHHLGRKRQKKNKVIGKSLNSRGLSCSEAANYLASRRDYGTLRLTPKTQEFHLELCFRRSFVDGFWFSRL